MTDLTKIEERLKADFDSRSNNYLSRSKESMSGSQNSIPCAFKSLDHESKRIGVSSKKPNLAIETMEQVEQPAESIEDMEQVEVEQEEVMESDYNTSMFNIQCNPNTL